MINDPQIIVIAGPTASGKTEAAIRLAELLAQRGTSAEIINADSVQLYKDLPILTARPLKNEQIRARHHMFGYLDAKCEFSVADWKKKVEKLLKQLHQKQKIAIICGGTGFYIDSLLNGISDIPTVPEEYRQNVFYLFQKIGRDNFFNKLQETDPDICKIIHPNNTQRILRAYEIATFTGKSLTHWWRQKKEKKHEALSIVINPPRAQLLERISFRICHMIQNGAIEEVSNFQHNYPNYNGPLSKVIGLQEILSLLNGKISTEQLIDQMFTRTRQYAKRQSTWFRNRMQNAIFVEKISQVPTFFNSVKL
ncbi:MAG: tRNA (adenosine(37)-N6)-dimethylallyltransferase MiaA [Alphaproteobacteria bacterium]|nr:tRNA (adenosine(37)-N6)-dimethylallyltransferase MiaA [Alphaproteobacteria bacterium]